jgi:hypothetical protein
MPIDVSAEWVIPLPPGEVAAYAMTGAMVPGGASHARSALWGGRRASAKGP